MENIIPIEDLEPFLSNIDSAARKAGEVESELRRQLSTKHYRTLPVAPHLQKVETLPFPSHYAGSSRGVEAIRSY